MNSLWNCEKCKKKYKTLKGFNNHKCINNNERRDSVDITNVKKKRKKKISPLVRFTVWKTYIGDKIEAKCFCCWTNRITPFTYCNTFHAGHIQSEANGGDIEIGNLLPICSDCNSSMGTTDWDEYIEKYSNFRIRIYGNNIPENTIQNIKKIQSYYRKYKKQKKQSVIIKKKKNKPNYLKPTKSFLKKRVKKRGKNDYL